MGDIGAVITFAFHDERLRPNDFFGRTESDGQSETEPRSGMLEPQTSDFAKTIAGAENEIDKLVLMTHFAEPVREIESGMKAVPIQNRKNLLQISARDKKIE